MKNVNKNLMKIIKRGIALVGTIACVFTLPSLNEDNSSNKEDISFNIDNLDIVFKPDNNINHIYDNEKKQVITSELIEDETYETIENNDDNINDSFENNDDNINDSFENNDDNINESSFENTDDNNIIENSDCEELLEYIDEGPKEVFISVKDYGVIGDGITDDTKSIKKIIKSCNENDYYTIYFPSGNYLVSNSIIISKSNIHIVGDDDATITFSDDINLDDDKKIIGVIVVKTINQDIENVLIDNIKINVNAHEKVGNNESLGRGITFIRQGKDEFNNYYEMKNVEINNCTIENAYSYGIATVGGEQLKEGYSEEYLNEIKNNYTQDFDNRMYYDYYDIENLTINNCNITNSRIGIRVNRVNNATISNNTINNSRLENLTIQGQNINVFNNKLYSHNGGSGSLSIDKSENINIYNNYINEQNSNTTKEIWKTGICQNSASGPSYNISINNNYIIGATRGIWIKNHLLSADPHKKNDAGSRPGAGFIIKDNKIFNSTITDIRIDELLDSKLNGDYIGNSYLYPSFCSVNLEAYQENEIGSNIKIEDIDYLELKNSSIIRIAKIDEDNNYIENSRLQITDEFGNIYKEFLSSNSEIIVDLPTGNYILLDLDTDMSVNFSVENNSEQQVIIGNKLEKIIF